MTTHIHAGREEDPLEDLWPEFMMNPWITTPGSIKVKYLGDWKWSFEVPGPKITDENVSSLEERKTTVRAWLAKLLTRMGRSLDYAAEKPSSPESH